MDKKNYVSIGKAALLIDCSTASIKRWYQWYESPRYEVPEGVKLPPYYHLDKRLTKYFDPKDIQMLKKFKRQLQTTHYGCMADYNADKCWGKNEKEGWERAKIWQKRKEGEYKPKSHANPTNVGPEYDKKEQEKWEQEQAAILRQRQSGS